MPAASSSFLDQWQNPKFKRKYSPDRQYFIREAMVVLVTGAKFSRLHREWEVAQQPELEGDPFSIAQAIVEDTKEYLYVGTMDEESVQFEQNIIKMIQTEYPEFREVGDLIKMAFQKLKHELDALREAENENEFGEFNSDRENRIEQSSEEKFKEWKEFTQEAEKFFNIKLEKLLEVKRVVFPELSRSQLRH